MPSRTNPSTTTPFLDDVLRGLQQSPKTLPCKYFYDAVGSRLFDRICELDEYYPTRTEQAITVAHADAIAARIGPRAMLVEYGSGSSIKTRTLLDHADDLVAYVPVDISAAHLAATAQGLRERYPDIEVLPVCADFTKPFELPVPSREPRRRTVYFPGSTIGNFAPDAARALLERIASQCGSGGSLVIGIDLQKDPRVLEAAYDDAEGVTAAFNLNLLRRINRELGADFVVEAFRHLARYDETHGRIEMHLESLRDQVVTIGGRRIAFTEGETICTEHSHKYTVDGFAGLAANAGFTVDARWTDDRDWFALLSLAVSGA